MKDTVYGDETFENSSAAFANLASEYEGYVNELRNDITTILREECEGRVVTKAADKFDEEVAPVVKEQINLFDANVGLNKNIGNNYDATEDEIISSIDAKH